MLYVRGINYVIWFNARVTHTRCPRIWDNLPNWERMGNYSPDKKTSTGTTISGNRSGYGQFPFKEYWGLPVIDFTGESFERCFEGLKILEKIRVCENITLLPDFIKSYQDAGYKVHLNGYEVTI